MTKKALLLSTGAAVIIVAALASLLTQSWFTRKDALVSNNDTLWEVQAIDTVKYSRDLAREKANDTSFDEIIEKHVADIASTGATHVALGTAYDEEFVPFLSRWVSMARKYDLNVWFRGNLSGWEGWFGYDRISRDEHINLTRNFILDNGDLFEDGDIFSACTECENGGPGDPRRTGDVLGHREFLINGYKVTNDAFRKVGKNVRSNFSPMNGDVAKLVMDKPTTKSLGGIVVIDHYVATPTILANDIKEIARDSGGKVMLGEFGAPILDIHGRMTEGQQADWIEDALGQLSDAPQLVGVNYWVSRGGKTQLWEDSGKPRMAVSVIEKYFAPEVVNGVVENEIGKPIAGAMAAIGVKTTVTQRNGEFSLVYVTDNPVLTISADGYKESKVDKLLVGQNTDIVLVKERENLLFKIRKLFAKSRI